MIEDICSADGGVGGGEAGTGSTWHQKDEHCMCVYIRVHVGVCMCMSSSVLGIIWDFYLL